MQRGASHAGTLTAPTAQDFAPAPTPEPPMGQMGRLEEATANTQAANLEAAKRDPSIQEKLNAMARARAKFYGEVQ